MVDSIVVNSDFDGGNIICDNADTPSNIQLRIAHDNNSEFFQWFYFSVTGSAGEARSMHINNAADAAYVGGWEDYRACVSYDKETWFRIDTVYENGVLSIHHIPENDVTYYAYFAPYSMARHAELISRTELDPRVQASVLGQTLDGQNVDLLTIGEPASGKLTYWITARQHPGETMAEWWMEGFIDRLLDPNDEIAVSLLKKGVFKLIPNMNPDGSKRGHLRTNAKGINLNREWDKTTVENSPEVFYVLNAMRETGVDFALDVHGDEALPYAFIAGTEGVPSFSKNSAALLDAYKGALVMANRHFQTEHGYPVNAPGTANLGLCSNFLAETFKCLAMTLEMPFKDNANIPDLNYGWSITRSRQLGADCLQAIYDIEGKIRASRL